MTNEEYKKIALKIYEDLFEGEENEQGENEQDNQDIEITNVGELFLGLFIESFSNIREEIPLCDYKNLIHTSNGDKDDHDDEASNDIFQPEYKKEIVIILIEFAFKALKIAIDNLSGNEYVLYNLGIKDVEGFISKVNHVWNTPKSDERYLNEFNILYDFLDGSNNSELTISFIIVSCLRVGQNYFLNRLEDFSFEEFIRDSKKMEQYFDGYEFLCEDRILYYKSLLRGIDNDNNRIKDFFDEYDLNEIFEIILKCNSFEDFEANIDSYEYTNNQKIIIIDAFLLLYYCIYLNPKFIVDMTFFYINGIYPFQMNEAILISLRSSCYAPLIQYEYEWWCKETGQTLDLPFPFSTEQFDKNNTTIVDYDLDKLKYAPNIPINAPESIKRIENREPDDKVMGQMTSVHVGEKQILDNLEPFIIRYVPAKERFINGKNSITDYMEDIIALSKIIKDSYNAYGFAYILFHSRFLKWNKMPFNIQFVETIISMFDIHIPENKMKDGHILNYEHKDAKRCAKKILTPRESLRHFLNRETLNSIDW